jgi:alpha-glucosidase
MLSDSPTQYEKEKESTEFIAAVPTVWDETKALSGEIGKFAAIARKNGNTWYAGALTNWTARDITLDLSFLGQGKYKAEIFKDGINANKDAEDYQKDTTVVTSSTQIKVHLAPGGGWAAKFTRQ